MFTASFTPRFYETDAFGHINNTVVAGWFETSREPIFRIFTAGPEPTAIGLILARTEVDFLAQIYYGHPVETRTWIERIGNSSFVVAHEAWQNGACAARGKAVQVAFDAAAQKSQPLSAAQRAALALHLMAPTAPG